MSKARSNVADYLVYVAVRLVVCGVQILPYRTGCDLAGAFAWLAYLVDRRHRNVALDNLRYAFPGQYTEAQLDRLVRAVYHHFFCLVIDIIHLPRTLRPKNWPDHVTLERPFWASTMLSDRPILLVCGHFGNWEVGGYIMGLLGFPIHAIARPLDNAYLDDFLRRFRERTGQKMLAKKGDFDRMQEVLARGSVLATMVDQDAGKRGLFVDFFGRPASTHKAPALLALEYKVPIAVIGCRRVSGSAGMRFPSFVVVSEELILPEDYDNHPDAARALTQRFTAGLERIIHTAPEQYFWLHRRWKHQPPPRKARRAA